MRIWLEQTLCIRHERIISGNLWTQVDRDTDGNSTKVFLQLISRLEATQHGSFNARDPTISFLLSVDSRGKRIDSSNSLVLEQHESITFE
mgnify:CR=1 FL=1